MSLYSVPDTKASSISDVDEGLGRKFLLPPAQHSKFVCLRVRWVAAAVGAVPASAIRDVRRALAQCQCFMQAEACIGSPETDSSDIKYLREFGTLAPGVAGHHRGSRRRASKVAGPYYRSPAFY